MFYQIDLSRLLLLLLLLGAGMFGATRLVPLERAGAGPSPRTLALRGMSLMTLLGLASGTAGGLLQENVAASPLIGVLHAIYSVCWAPVFALAQLQELLAAQLASSHFSLELFGPLALLLLPVIWFLVFLCAGQLWARWRRSH